MFLKNAPNGAPRVLQSIRNHHKSTDGKILHRRYTQIFSQLRKKIELDKHLRFKIPVIIDNENHSKPTREYPYRHRIDRGNTHFQIMQKIFTWLENAFAGTGWP